MAKITKIKGLINLIADRYPKTAKPELAIDKKTGKEYLAKKMSNEAKQLEQARKEAMKDIKAGNYDPFFPVENRFYADQSKYSLSGRTAVDALPKKQETIDKYRKLIDTKETRSKLDEAYAKAENDPLAKDWYAVGQLEKVFIDRYGEELGRKLFKERFADAMAATTGGADPTSNLLMATLGNFYKRQGIDLPTQAYNYPYPVGGRFVAGNMGMYDRVINQGQGLLASKQPKRFNFSSNFLGYRDRPTIDEQMMTLFPGNEKAPPGQSYGVYEQVINDAAKRAGVNPVNFQDVSWAGAKNVEGKPMIQHVNEAIERTARVTGKNPKDVVVDSLVRAKSPLYSVAPTAVILADEYQGDPVTGMDLSEAGADVPFLPTMKEYGLSALRGAVQATLDSMKGASFVPGFKKVAETAENTKIPDYEAKYATDEQKTLFELLGSFIQPNLR